MVVSRAVAFSAERVPYRGVSGPAREQGTFAIRRRGVPGWWDAAWLPLCLASLVGLTACDSKDETTKDETKVETISRTITLTRVVKPVEHNREGRL